MVSDLSVLQNYAVKHFQAGIQNDAKQILINCYCEGTTTSLHWLVLCAQGCDTDKCMLSKFACDYVKALRLDRVRQGSHLFYGTRSTFGLVKRGVLAAEAVGDVHAVVLAARIA